MHLYGWGGGGSGRSSDQGGRLFQISCTRGGGRGRRLIREGALIRGRVLIRGNTVTCKFQSDTWNFKGRVIGVRWTFYETGQNSGDCVKVLQTMKSAQRLMGVVLYPHFISAQKYSLLPCCHLDFETAVTAQNAEFKQWAVNHITFITCVMTKPVSLSPSLNSSREIPPLWSLSNRRNQSTRRNRFSWMKLSRMRIPGGISCNGKHGTTGASRNKLGST